MAVRKQHTGFERRISQRRSGRERRQMPASPDFVDEAGIAYHRRLKYVQDKGLEPGKRYFLEPESRRVTRRSGKDRRQS